MHTLDGGENVQYITANLWDISRKFNEQYVTLSHIDTFWSKPVYSNFITQCYFINSRNCLTVLRHLTKTKQEMNRYIGKNIVKKIFLWL